MVGTSGGGSRVDRAVTLGGRGRKSPTGELSTVTKGIYGRRWAGSDSSFTDWCRVNHRRAMPCTPETLAEYVEWLTQNGYATATARLGIEAVRWMHRVRGEPVPDGVAAWYVLRGLDPTPGESAEVKSTVARRVALSALADAADLSRVRGVRTMALVALVYGTAARDGELVGLDLADVRLTRGTAHVRLPGRSVSIVHDPDPGHDRQTCLRCRVAGWVDALHAAGASGGPLLRSVDKGDNIGGCGRKAGRPTEGGRLTVQAVHRILKQLVVTAGLPWAGRPGRALRLGNAAEAYAAGSTIAEAAVGIGYTPGSDVLLRVLTNLERTTR